MPYFEREHIEIDKVIPWFPNNELQSDRDATSGETENMNERDATRRETGNLNERELRPRRVRRPPEYLRDYVVD